MKNQTFSPSSEPEPPEKRNFGYLIIPALIMFGLSLFLIFSGKTGLSPKFGPDSSKQPLDGSVESLLYTQLPQTLAEKDLTSWTLDDISFSEDKLQALLWMSETDKETGTVLAREPHVVLAQWNETSSRWKLYFAEDADFPQALLSSQFKDFEFAGRFVEDDGKTPSTGKTYGDYYLPWAAGLTKRLTWSVGHGSCAPGICTYAFDFADYTMFDILAAKGGYVYHWRDTCNNGNPSCTNSITLEDRSTNPWTYQIYLHLAKNSIPPELKQKGASVARGQKIANVDDTGYSTGHHLHFMVIEKQNLDDCKYYCWGKSSDITFKDVSINWDPATQGGRPRLASEARWYGGVGQTNYVSGNQPVGTLPSPVPQPVPGEPLYYAVVNTSTGFRLRVRRTPAGDFVRWLEPGDVVSVYEKIGAWARIGVDEWVEAAWLKQIVEPLPFKLILFPVFKP